MGEEIVRYMNTKDGYGCGAGIEIAEYAPIFGYILHGDGDSREWVKAK